MAEVAVSVVRCEEHPEMARCTIEVWARPWIDLAWIDLKEPVDFTPLQTWSRCWPIGRHWSAQHLAGHLVGAVSPSTTTLVSPEFVNLPELPMPGVSLVLCVHRMMTELVEVIGHRPESEIVEVRRGANGTAASAFPPGAQWSLAPGAAA